MKKIGWYTRDGHLDFLSKLSLKLKANGNDIDSYYACHTKGEGEKLVNNYKIKTWVLADYIEDRKKSFSFSEEQIRELEKRYDLIPLRRLLWSEMHMKRFSEEKMIFHLISHFEFWERFLREYKINAIVSERPSILSTCVLWVICKKEGIEFLDFYNIPIDDRIVLTSSWKGDIDGLDEKIKAFNNVEKLHMYGKAIKYLEKMVNRPEKPEYIFRHVVSGKKIKHGKLYQSFPKIGNIFQVHQQWSKVRGMREYYIREPLINLFLNPFMSHVRSLLFKRMNLFERNIDPSKERYFLFPLHILMEWSNYPWMGLKYPNIISVINEVASCLPLGCKLYVKEHTTNFPEKKLSFYRSIKRIKGVRLINPFEDTFDLLRNTEGVITLGGTMGWEALLIGKPVINLAFAWYRKFPGVYSTENAEALTELLQKAHTLPVATEEEKLRAICALYEVSFEGIRYPVVDLIKNENVERYVMPFEAWLRNKVVAD